MKSRLALILKASSALASGAILLHAAPAAAAISPESNQIVFSPTNPDLIVVRTTYGVLPSRDHGATWQFICLNALGIGPTEDAVDPSIGLTRNDSLLVGVAQQGVNVSPGLNVSPDVGCNWKCIAGPLANQAIADLAVRTDSPSSAVAITRTYFAVPDSGFETFSQVFETNDNGATWTALGVPIDPQVVVETVAVAKTDPNRLYVSGTRGIGSERTTSLFVSQDKGGTWTEWPLPTARFDPIVEDSIFIGAVDPTNADRVYLRSSALVTGGQSRLTVVTFAADGKPTFTGVRSFDAGASFTGTSEMLGLAVSDDGSKIYIGSVEDGLWMASTSDLKFTKKSSIRVQCLATRGNELWACSAELSGFIAGVSTDDGVTFAPKLPLLGTLTGPIACAARANEAGAACGTNQNASQCGPAYQGFCSDYGCGPPEAGTGDEESKPPPPNSSSSCDVSFAGICRCGGGAALAAVFAIASAAVRRRRRRG